jgi:hypothetical protein
MRKQNLKIFSDGFVNFLTAMIEHYGLTVKTNIIINQIERANDRVIISYEENQMPKVEQFSYVVVASGLSSMHWLFGNKISNIEKRLASDIRYRPYDVIVASVPGLSNGSYIIPDFFDHLGHVVMMSKNSKSKEEVTLYVPRAGFQRPSRQLLEETVSEDLAIFGLNDVKILRIAYWDNFSSYFKNFSSYGLLNKIQGQNRTIYVGGFARFEIVEEAIRHAHDMVDKLIIKKVNKKGLLKSIKDRLLANKKEL